MGRVAIGSRYANLCGRALANAEGIQSTFRHNPRIAFAVCDHVDNRLRNKIGDRIVWIADAHVDQGGLYNRRKADVRPDYNKPLPPRTSVGWMMPP